MKLLAFTVLSSTLLITSASGQLRSTDTELTKARTEYAKQLERYDQKIEEHLNKQLTKARNAGDIESVRTAKFTLDEYKQYGKVPKLPMDVQRVLTKAKDKLELAYRKHIKLLLRNQNDEAAEKYDRELKELLKQPQRLELTQTQVIKITAKKPIGYEIGAFKKGEKLALQYRSGRWKGWGRNPTESPDDVVTQQGDRCRVAIGEIRDDGTFVKLAVVPAKTIAEAFEWTADATYKRIILRINDTDNKFANNPDKGVEYDLQLYRYKP